MWTLWRKAGESSSIERILDICLAGGPDDLWSNSPALWEPPILYKTGGGTRPSAFIEANPTSLQIRMIYVMGLQGRQEQAVWIEVAGHVEPTKGRSTRQLPQKASIQALHF